MIVVGAGVIGVEYACIFAALGTRVTLVEKRDTMLEFVDREIIDALTYHMRDHGVLFRLGEEVADCSLADGHVIARTASRKTVLGECLPYTVGRRGATDDLNLKAVGLEADDRGRIAVDANYRTAVPWIYAAGDVIGFPALAPLRWSRAGWRHATRSVWTASRSKPFSPMASTRFWRSPWRGQPNRS
jgi:NAD(P) transhydrogenase